MQHTTREWQQLKPAIICIRLPIFRPWNKKGSRIITKAEGVYLGRLEGKRILDGMAGLWCVNMGYGRQELVDAATRQMQQLPYYNLFFPDQPPPAARAGHPAGRDHPFPPQPSSSPARVPSATTPCCRMVRHYWASRDNLTKRVIISRHNAYHGSTVAGASLGGMKGMHLGRLAHSGHSTHRPALSLR